MELILINIHHTVDMVVVLKLDGSKLVWEAEWINTHKDIIPRPKLLRVLLFFGAAT